MTLHILSIDGKLPRRARGRRPCIACRRRFLSEHCGHRLCDACNPDANVMRERRREANVRAHLARRDAGLK